MTELRNTAEQANAADGGNADADVLRRELAEADRRLVASLQERARLARALHEVDAENVDSPDAAALAAAGPGAAPLDAEAMTPVFREVMSATRALDEDLAVAFLGPRGTFSHQAALSRFGSRIELEPAGTIAEVFALVERGRARYGIVPLENSTEGAVTETLDTLVETDLSICGELTLQITECLLSRSGRIEDVRRVVSHPQALGQCRQWIQRHLPEADVVEVASTATAAREASRDGDCAAIGSEAAVDVYGLRIVEQAIEDRRGNTTRFAVIGRDRPASTGNDLTSAVFTVHKDQSGTLFQLLEPFARHDVSLTTIQSRPMKGKPWEYLFFVDLEGHAADEAVARALEEASAVAYSHKILGSYPRATARGVGTSLAAEGTK